MRSEWHWFVRCDLQIFSGCVCPLEQLHAQSPFLFPIVFSINLFRRRTSNQSHHITADQGHLDVMHVEMRVGSVVDLQHSLCETMAFRTCYHSMHMSGKKRSHSCETNSQRQPHRWRTIRLRRQLAWLVIGLSSSKSHRLVGDRRNRLGVVQGPPRRFGHRPEILPIW